MLRDRLHVLLVDDDEMDGFVIRKAFAQATPATSFDHLTSGRELFQRFGAGKPTQGGDAPDILLLDINMPGMNGFDVLSRWRKEPRLGAIPVVMLTTSALPDDIVRAYRESANSYIVKPSSFDGLEDFVAGFLRYWAGVARLPGRAG
jgi:CheY-like chemotaxis protein